MGDVWDPVASYRLKETLSRIANTQERMRTASGSRLASLSRQLTSYQAQADKLQSQFAVAKVGSVSTYNRTATLLGTPTVAADAKGSYPLPHPDASDETLGPNLGGEDAVLRPGDTVSGSGGSGPLAGAAVSGIGLAVVGIILVVLIAGGKK